MGNHNVTQRRHTRQQTRTMNTVGMKCNVRAARVANKQNARATRVVQCRASANNFVEKVKDASKVAAAIGASVLVAGSAAPSAQALTFNEKQALTYLQVKGSGLANTCPVLDDGVSDLRSLKAGDYNISKFCLEPTSFQEESAFHSCSPSRNSLLRVTWVSSEVTSSSHPTEDPPFWTLRVEVPPPVMTLLLPSQPQVTPRSSRRKTQSPRRFLREALFLARPLSTAPLVRLLESLRASSHLIPTSEPRHQRILRSLACGMDS